MLIFSLIVYTNTLCNLIALSPNYTSPAYNRPNAGRRDGASTDINCLTVNVDTLSPFLPGFWAIIPLTAGFVACIRTDEMAWVDSALWRLYSTWKACDRNCIFPCWYRDFDCFRLQPKQSFFDHDSVIDPTLSFLPCDAMRCTVSVIVILSVRLSFRLSHSCTVSTWFDLRSWFLRHMVAPSF